MYEETNESTPLGLCLGTTHKVPFYEITVHCLTNIDRMEFPAHQLDQSISISFL